MQAHHSRAAIAVPAPNTNEPHGENIQNESSENLQEPVNGFRNPDWWMVFLTALLFVVGFVTLVVFYRQFGEMQKQTRILNTQAQQAAADSIEAAKKMNEQLKIATEQTKAAQASVKAIQRQMRQDQRAWMKIAPPTQGLETPSPNKTYSIPLHFSNIGKSSALDVFVVTYLDIVPKNREPNLDYTSAVHGHDFTGIVYPGDSYDISAMTFDRRRPQPLVAEPIPLGDDYGRLLSGEVYIVYFAKVTYRDIFGTQHWTHFCAWHTFVPGGVGPYVMKCVRYNRADNN